MSMEIPASKASPFRAIDNPMDAAALFIALSTEPTVIDSHALSLRGGMTPIILPIAGLAPVTRARFIVHHDALPLENRVAAALEVGDTESAWQLIIRSAGAANRNPALDVLLNRWAAQELARRKLTAPRDVILLLSTNDAVRRTMDVAIAHSTVHEMLSGIHWPRWSGPLIVVVGDMGERDPYPDQERIVRPVIPLVRMSETTPGMTPREVLCVRMTELALALEAPPAQGWPAWLTVGLNEVVKAKMRGEGPSPIKMLSIRQTAGLKALEQLLTDEKPDAALAMALCAPLVHSRRRQLLGNLLDLLRGGAASPGAIRVAYGLTLAQLLEER